MANLLEISAEHRRTGKLALAARRAFCLLPTALCLLPHRLCIAGEPASPISIESAQVTLIDQVRVPTKESGVLAVLSVREGDTVKAGQLLGTVECDRERVAKEQTVFEFQMAEEKALNDVDVRMAKKDSRRREKRIAPARRNQSSDFRKAFPRRSSTACN